MPFTGSSVSLNRPAIIFRRLSILAALLLAMTSAYLLPVGLLLAMSGEVTETFVMWSLATTAMAILVLLPIRLVYRSRTFGWISCLATVVFALATSSGLYREAMATNYTLGQISVFALAAFLVWSMPISAAINMFFFTRAIGSPRQHSGPLGTE